MSQNNTEHEVLGYTADGHALLHGPDDLEEVDRPMPFWLRAVTIATIVWGVGYFLWMPGGANLSGWTQNQSYANEVAAAKAKIAAAPAPAGGGDGQAALAAMLDDPAAIKAGEDAYGGNCLACHGAAGAGGIGPALNDATWVHGGSAEEIAHVVEKGTDKGMPPFGSLPATTRNQLVAYVKSLHK